MQSLQFRKTIIKLFFLFLLFTPVLLAGTETSGGQNSAVVSVCIAILAATAMAFIAHILKQPLLLAYIIAGIVIGPKIGLGLIKNSDDIETISHFGLILLLFLIGLEIDIKKIKTSGKSLLISGISQFPINALIGIGFFLLLGYSFETGKFDLFYLTACCSLSSTAIVVKLLYGKFELDTLAGRISLGILVFQDIWAIILLGIQPNLANPDILNIFISFARGGLLVAVSLLASKYILPKLFSSIAKVPELVLVSSLAWCFLVCGAAAYLDLSMEMGALIAGIAISTFPYNLDVIAKVVYIRDFFVTLFFVSLGMRIPDSSHNLSILWIAAISSVFLIASRFLSVFPVLYSLKNGLRVSSLTSINLGQISEFSLVIAALGVTAGHISQDTMSVIIFVFVTTSIISTYMITYSDSIQKLIAVVLNKCGLKEIESAVFDDEEVQGKEIALLGFHRTASSLLSEILNVKNLYQGIPLKDKVVVVDFNPEMHESLQNLGIKVVYGDIGHLNTLHHAKIHDVKIVISTIPDTILVGTNNLKIIRHIKSISPKAKIIVTSDSIENALKMYSEGADYVFMPRILAAENLLNMIDLILNDKQKEMKMNVNKEIELLSKRKEIIR